MKIAVINGPNLNFLGIREPEIYGNLTLEEINQSLEKFATNRHHDLIFFQSNHEGAIIDFIQECYHKNVEGIIINPAAYTHYSYGIHDALKAVTIPTVEVHLSHLQQREDFRKHSVTAPACIGQISGLGSDGYILALLALERHKGIED